MQYCSLQHWTLLPSPVTSTTGHCFHFGSASSFFLELFFHSSPVAYWAPTDMEIHLSVFYLFTFSYCSRGSQGKNTEVVCHFLLQWTMFCQNSPPWPVHLGWPYMAHSFTELDKAVVHVMSLTSFLWLWFSFGLLSSGQGRLPRGATPCPKSGGCTGTGGLRGATARSRSGGAAMRRYPSSKVRETQERQ